MSLVEFLFHVAFPVDINGSYATLVPEGVEYIGYFFRKEIPDASDSMYYSGKGRYRLSLDLFGIKLRVQLVTFSHQTSGRKSARTAHRSLAIMNNDEWTLLIQDCNEGRLPDPQKIMELLKAGVNPDREYVHTRTLTYTLLAILVIGFNNHTKPEYIELAKILTNHGANPNKEFWLGGRYTPTTYLCNNNTGNADLLNVMIKAGGLVPEGMRCSAAYKAYMKKKAFRIKVLEIIFYR